MCLSKKILLGLILAYVFCGRGISQVVDTPSSLIQKGQSLIKKNPSKAYALFVEAMRASKRNKDLTTYGIAVNMLAHDAIEHHRNRDSAFAWTKEALEIFKKAPDDTIIAQLHYHAAEFYFFENEIELPIDHFERSKKIWIDFMGPWNKHVAKCYHGLGDVNKYTKYDFREAEKCYENALLIREKIQSHDSTDLYENYYSLAATNRSQRDFEKAVSYGNKALEIAERLEDSDLELTYGMVANIYRDMKQSELAKKYYLTALNLNKKAIDSDKQAILKRRAWYYMCLGETFMMESQYSEALKYFSMSYSFYTSGREYKPLLARLMIDMVETYSLNNDEKKLKNLVAEVFSELAALDKVKSKEAYTVFLLVGDHHSRKKRYDSALYYYQKAFIAVVPAFHSLKPEDNPTENMIGIVYYIYEGLAKKASVLKSKFDITKDPDFLRQSLDCLILAEKLVSKSRNALDMENAKWEFLDANYDLYENILSNLYEGIQLFPRDTLINLTFRYFEQSKSRSLADALVQSEQTDGISGNDSLLRFHGELKRKLFNVQHNISEALEAKEGKEKISALHNEVVNLDLSLEASKRVIEERYPGYFNVRYGYSTPSPAEIFHVNRERGQVLLEYFWGSEWVYGIAVTNDEIVFKRIGKPDSIKTIVNEMLRHFGYEQASLNLEVFQRFVSNSHQLYQILVEPFSSVLTTNPRIQIIPDGPISQVPFEVLLEERADMNHVDYRSLKYFIKSFAIGYAYSSSMLMHKKNTVLRRPTLLAVGFTGGRRLRGPEEELGDIQGVEEELELLEKRFGSGKFLVGNDATEANFKTLSPDFDIIHLAIHGKGDVLKNFSASLFFRSKYDSLDDGELHAYELYGLKLRAVMAVLSACESGLGKGYKGEGMISMASAFTYSGCQNILMSLWKVNDQASIAMMDDFYAQLEKGDAIDDALRQAKLSYLSNADELTSDPKIWAPLVAYGSLDEVFNKDRSVVVYVSVGVLLVLLLIFFLRKKNN